MSRGRRTTLGVRGLLLGLLLALTLCACGSSGNEAMLNTYLARLARPLNASATPVAARVDAPPRAEALMLSIASDSLDGLDFLRLRGCALQATVARRNSSLGRVAPPSQRLLLELAFLREAPPCIDKLDNDGERELAGQLREAITRKTAQLPRLIFNATLASIEFRDFWRSTRLPPDYPANTNSLVVTALEHIVSDTKRWLAGDYAADERRFELALSTVAQGDGGELLRALQLQHNALTQANRLIEQRRSQGPLCRAGLKPDAADVLRTVARKYFVGEVQRWSASLSQRFHALTPPFTTLENTLSGVLPPSYRQWQAARNQLLSEGMDAPAAHVTQLQNLLGSCYAEFGPEASAPGRKQP